MKKLAGVDPTTRADYKKAHVIISEKRDKKAARYQVRDLPYPYTSRAQFERSMEVPLGTEWNTRVGFQRATLPKVVTKVRLLTVWSWTGVWDAHNEVLVVFADGHAYCAVGEARMKCPLGRRPQTPFSFHVACFVSPSAHILPHILHNSQSTILPLHVRIARRTRDQVW